MYFYFKYGATTEIYTLSLHDALPISPGRRARRCSGRASSTKPAAPCATAVTRHRSRRSPPPTPAGRSNWRLPRTPGDFVRVAADGVRPGYSTPGRDGGRGREEGDHRDADRRPDLHRRDRPRRDVALVASPPAALATASHPTRRARSFPHARAPDRHRHLPLHRHRGLDEAAPRAG